MINGLAWYRYGRQASPYHEYSGPSWSWAGHNGPANTQPRVNGWLRDVATVNGWHAEPKNKSNPYGEVKPGAWVKIYGPVTDLNLITGTEETTDGETQLRFCTLYSDDGAGTEVFLDHAEHRISDVVDKRLDLQVMILGGLDFQDIQDVKRHEPNHEDTATKPIAYFYGLVIRRSGQGEETEKLERLGTMEVGKVEGNRILEDQRNWRSITLV